jgi:hypothetical protein
VYLSGQSDSHFRIQEMDTHIPRTTVFAMKTLETTLSYWRGFERSAASASRQISDFVHQRALLGRSTPKQPSTERPNGRDAAVGWDPARAAISAGHDSHQEALQGEMGPGREKANREAIERGENEGMAVPSKERTARRRESGTAS